MDDNTIPRIVSEHGPRRILIVVCTRHFRPARKNPRDENPPQTWSYYPLTSFPQFRSSLSDGSLPAVATGSMSPAPMIISKRLLSLASGIITSSLIL